MKKVYTVWLVVLMAVVVCVAMFFVFTKALHGPKMHGSYYTEICECQGIKIFGRCWGELADCLYLD